MSKCSYGHDAGRTKQNYCKECRRRAAVAYHARAAEARSQSMTLADLPAGTRRAVLTNRILELGHRIENESRRWVAAELIVELLEARGALAAVHQDRRDGGV